MKIKKNNISKQTRLKKIKIKKKRLKNIKIKKKSKSKK